MSVSICPNKHQIGGENHHCIKKDLRVFYNEESLNKVKQNSSYNPVSVKNFESFVAITFKQFKNDYVAKSIIKPKKGIVKNYDIRSFQQNYNIRDMNIITFRILNFILYSYILGSYILDYIKQEELQSYLVDNLFPNKIFVFLKKNWELLDLSLKEKGFENIQVFLNMTFEKMNEFISTLKSVDNYEQLISFEKRVNDYIMGIISNKNNIDILNKDYKKINNKLLLIFDQYGIKEMIMGNYDPSIYDQKIYPDIQYFTLSKMDDYNSFKNKFQSNKDNENRYTLINLLVNNDEELSQNIINMKNLDNINKLTNLLLNIYYMLIRREDAKNIKFKDEWKNIIDRYKEINNNEVFKDVKEFEREYVKPFIKSWDKIKKKCTMYNCRNLGENKTPPYLDMTVDLPISYFLVDDGDIGYGMYLASAYQQFIDWQNTFLNLIISNNKMGGLLNSYIFQLEQEINIQEATKDEIINIDEKTYQSFEKLISSCSIRNIFSKDNIIKYKNYNDIIYNYDYIEEELAKIILPGLKKFKPDGIKFVTYLYEGFRGKENEDIIKKYNSKYNKKPLSVEEKEILSELAKKKNMKIFNEVFSSLQILMNEIIKDNYEQDTLIYDIIEKLPNYVILNKELVDLLKRTKEHYLDEKIFTIHDLVSMFEYFEALCWPQIKQNLLRDYKWDIDEESKNYVINYFKTKENQEKIINLQDLTFALRRLISRYLAGTRQDVDIDSKVVLSSWLKKNEFWSKEIAENVNKDLEIDALCPNKIKIGSAFELYNALGGDNILNKFIDENKKKETQKAIEFEMKTPSEKPEKEKKVDNDKENSSDEEEKEEEEEEENERDDY